MQLANLAPSWPSIKAKGPITRKFMTHVDLTGQERTFSQDELIVSKTDLKGHITYANDVFLRIAGLTEDEAVGAPHSIIRHPDMPRAVFKLLWDTLEAGNEIFAYVVNMAVNGDHYWVFAHVTPTFGPDGQIIGYHSNRRVPDPRVIPQIEELYGLLREIEASHGGGKKGMEAAVAKLVEILQSKNVSYDEFIFSL